MNSDSPQADLADKDEIDFDPFAAGAIEAVIPTTGSQKEIWLGHQMQSDAQAALAYNLSITVRLRGSLDTLALRAALDGLVARHQSLRSTFSADGSQMLVAEPGPVDLAEHDLSAEPSAQQVPTLNALLAQSMSRPFDLQNGPLFQGSLYRLSPLDHLLALRVHHAVSDGWSLGLMRNELAQLYAASTGHPHSLQPAPLFSEFVDWQHAEASTPDSQSHVDYWVSKFSTGTPPVLQLPLDHARPAVRTFAARRVVQPIDRALVTGLRKLAGQRDVSLYSVLLSGFATTLNRLTAQDDIVIGIPSAGQPLAALPGLVGQCVNTLLLRFDIDGKKPFDALMTQARSLLLDAIEHRQVTYARLLGELQVERDPSRLPLVSVLFNARGDGIASSPGFTGLEVEFGSLERVADNFELSIHIEPSAAGMDIECHYNTALFDEATVKRWLSMYASILEDAVARPECAIESLRVMTDTETGALAALQPRSTPAIGERLMHAGFVASARSTPERVALVFDGVAMSYGELDAASTRLARAMRRRGVQRGQLIGLCLPRNAEMVVALIAVLKTGAAYVPLDPDFPEARLQYYAEDAGLALLVTRSDVASAPRAWRADAADRVLDLDDADAWHGEPSDPIAPGALDAQPQDVAYVIYTSGSTGKPKGVALPHGAIANFLQSMAREPGMTRDDALVAVTTLSFDIAVLELMLPLCVGARVVIAPREVSMSGPQLNQLLVQSGATMMQATPGTWRLLLDSGWKGAPGFKALIGGESLPVDLGRTLVRSTGELWNMYGPTETTVWSTVCRIDAAALAKGAPAIGRPIDNTTVYILDEARQLVPQGIPGEICIGGDGVAIGYLHRPELTQERFITTDIDGVPTRLYRTGDRGRWRNDGLLEHMGRLDFQVKVRGYRIELGEIEARCDEFDGVTRSVVVAHEEQPGDTRLVAYLAMPEPDAFDRRRLGAHLRATLPQYMVPQHIVAMAALPLLPNGKIDRKALPAPSREKSEAPVEPAGAAGAATGHAARSMLQPEQAQLAQLWAVAIGIDVNEIDAGDNFFDLGGDSLLAMRVIEQSAQLLGTRVEARRYVFESLASLAAAPKTRAVAANETPVQEKPRGLLRRLFSGKR